MADPKYVTYDAAKAAEELQAYTADTGQSKLSFTLKLSTGGAFPQVAVALQAQWAAVGIDAQIGELEQATFLADTFLGNYQASIFRNFGYVNPDSNYLFWSSTTAKGIGNGSINFTQTKVPAIDQGLDGARASNDDADAEGVLRPGAAGPQPGAAVRLALPRGLGARRPTRRRRPVRAAVAGVRAHRRQAVVDRHLAQELS